MPSTMTPTTREEIGRLSFETAAQPWPCRHTPARQGQHRDVLPVRELFETIGEDCTGFATIRDLSTWTPTGREGPENHPPVGDFPQRASFAPWSRACISRL